MRAHRPLVFTLVLSAAALTSSCTERKQEPPDSAKEKTISASQPATWDGKEDAEAAMQRATRALNAVEPETAARQDSDTTTLAKGLDRTFTMQGKRPYTFDIACQTPATHTLTLKLIRGDVANEWDVECGDREADQLDIPAGAPITAQIRPASGETEGIISWRLNTVGAEDVQDCMDDITEC
ncbi:hypothetical protein GCM10010269_26760 [Streptomyces humidus]|uniref:Lipoprotein n=1 Tax=Streptomyces humidus TaxID=52259 RepID=A0A918FUL5_9ACTN|nr:hypothetical protein [Streptomyces humidus]GGR86223.1 hypothetical protein GCM10010269_26760 [Streptomyces humidus]